MGWGLGLGPAWMGEAACSEGCPGVWSSRVWSKALGEGVWVGFRPSAVGGGLRVWGVEVGPWVGV